MATPPLLTYADDAPQEAQMASIRMLKRCVLITAITYYCMFALSVILPGWAGSVTRFFSYGVQIVMIVFVIWLAMKLQNLLLGVVLAFLVSVPCAGPCIPFYLVGQANERLRELARERKA